MATLLDSYSETNKDSSNSLTNNGGGENTQCGESFTTPNDGISYTLNSGKFYLANEGLMTGTTRIAVYAHSGTFGTSSVPTGSALAVSDTIDTSTISVDPIFALTTFVFSGVNLISLTANTNYCLLVECPTGNGSASVKLNVGKDGSSPTAAGNLFNSTDNGANWSPVSTQDYCFYIYGDAPASAVKTVNGLARASVKTKNGLAIASVKTFNGLV